MLKSCLTKFPLFMTSVFVINTKTCKTAFWFYKLSFFWKRLQSKLRLFPRFMLYGWNFLWWRTHTSEQAFIFWSGDHFLTFSNHAFQVMNQQQQNQQQNQMGQQNYMQSNPNYGPRPPGQNSFMPNGQNMETKAVINMIRNNDPKDPQVFIVWF